MFDRLNYIELSEERYPIKCDMVVLEEIQDKYVDLSEFENRLTGFTPAKDSDGEYKRSNTGALVGSYGIPDIEALNDALYWMVREGTEIEAEERNAAPEKIEREKVLRRVDIPPVKLSRILHEEFSRCFKVKNAETTQRKATEEKVQK